MQTDKRHPCENHVNAPNDSTVFNRHLPPHLGANNTRIQRDRIHRCRTGAEQYPSANCKLAACPRHGGEATDV